MANSENTISIRKTISLALIVSTRMNKCLNTLVSSPDRPFFSFGLVRL